MAHDGRHSLENADPGIPVGPRGAGFGRRPVYGNSDGARPLRQLEEDCGVAARGDALRTTAAALCVKSDRSSRLEPARDEVRVRLICRRHEMQLPSAVCDFPLVWTVATRCLSTTVAGITGNDRNIDPPSKRAPRFRNSRRGFALKQGLLMAMHPDRALHTFSQSLRERSFRFDFPSSAPAFARWHRATNSIVTYGDCDSCASGAWEALRRRSNCGRDPLSCRRTESVRSFLPRFRRSSVTR